MLPPAARLVVLIGLVPALRGAAQDPPALVLSEVLASNTRTSFDENGRSSDWIEIENRGPRGVDLEGFTLADDAANLKK